MMVWLRSSLEERMGGYRKGSSEGVYKVVDGDYFRGGFCFWLGGIFKVRGKGEVVGFGEIIMSGVD